MTARARNVIAAAIDRRLDVFRERAEARAHLVEACLLDFYDAIDELADAAMKCGLVRDIGWDALQQELARAFAWVPRPEAVIEDEAPASAPEIKTYFDEAAFFRTCDQTRAAYVKAEAERKNKGSRQPFEVAASTIAATDYLIRQNDPARLRAWLAKLSAAERIEIRKHLGAKHYDNTKVG